MVYSRFVFKRLSVGTIFSRRRFKWRALQKKMGKLNPRFFTDDNFDSFADPRRRQSGKTRPPKRTRDSAQNDHVVRDEIARYSDDQDLVSQGGFNPTFTSSFFERDWILNYLGVFYDNHQITDVLKQVKGGKEATVYCCAAHPATGRRLLAAKVYRPRMFRQLRNDALYRQGRKLYDGDGKEMREWRDFHAVDRKTAFGMELRQTSWITHEYHALEMLSKAGVLVPTPVAFGNNTILMDYMGDAHIPAPALTAVRLGKAEARLLFELLLDNIEKMLSLNVVHGDLSAFNVLYWEGEVRLIDFPQAIDPRLNREASAIFRRDVERICQHFARYGLGADARALADNLWRKYQPADDPLPPEALEE